jgi:hypothetical protein
MLGGTYCLVFSDKSAWFPELVTLISAVWSYQYDNLVYCSTSQNVAV